MKLEPKPFFSASQFCRMILFLVLALSNILTSCVTKNHTSQVSPSHAFNEQANSSFLQTIALGVNMNTGITMIRQTSLQTDKEEPWFKNNVSYIVLNHTSESVIFPDQGFGLVVYGYDLELQTWHIVTLPHYPAKISTILPPHLEKIDFDLMNIWNIPGNEFQNISDRELRLFISGTGTNTNVVYGAYLDIIISP
jgi:hypothetical protein